jgi:hypothetical protein
VSRLTAGKYSGSSMPGSSYGTNTGYFDESYAYDIMGNMTSLARKHGNTLIDALTFGYTGNMLHQVADGENNSLGFSGTGTYTYDVAGRMTDDSQKGTRHMEVGLFPEGSSW